VAAETALRPPSAAPAAPPASAPLRRLTERAWLNAAASVLDYGAKIVVGLLVTPVLVSGLGRTLFGVWEMLGRLMSYAHAADGRPTEALRLVVAGSQGAGAEPQRRFVGAALVVWLLVLPAVAALGALIVWWAPSLTKVPAWQSPVVRLTAVLLVASFLVGSLASVPESVLRGMNLGYRRMGLQASLNVAGGLLATAAVWTGLGLAGLGGAQLLRYALTGLCFWALVRSNVAWFGVARPRWSEVRTLLGMGVWLTAGEMVARVLLASDVLVLGAVVSPAAVTTYVLTGYAARTALGIHIFTAGAAMPGLGGVIGNRELARAALARQELQALTWLFATAVGATILLWNRSFLSLWVGAEHYAGLWIDLLIVLITVQTAFIRTDAYIIDAALRPKQRVLVAAAAAVLTLGLTVTMTRAYGVAGLCVGTLLGRSVQSLAYPLLARRCLGRPTQPLLSAGAAARLGLVSAALLGACAALGQRVLAGGWISWAAAVPATLVLISVAALAAGPPPALRHALVTRLKALPRAARRRP
jgi:O-antigen/teichoic acid export membrane protein